MSVSLKKKAVTTDNYTMNKTFFYLFILFFLVACNGELLAQTKTGFPAQAEESGLLGVHLIGMRHYGNLGNTKD